MRKIVMMLIMLIGLVTSAFANPMSSWFKDPTVIAWESDIPEEGIHSVEIDDMYFMVLKYGNKYLYHIENTTTGWTYETYSVSSVEDVAIQTFVSWIESYSDVHAFDFNDLVCKDVLTSYAPGVPVMVFRRVNGKWGVEE